MKAIILFLAVSSTAMAADDYRYDPKDTSYRTGFESAGGAKYQYDLAKPSEELRYQNDYSAQQRDFIDSLSPHPSRELHESIHGQTGRGGGVRR